MNFLMCGNVSRALSGMSQSMSSLSRACLASMSAVSFPWRPTWAGTHSRVTWQPETQRVWQPSRMLVARSRRDELRERMETRALSESLRMTDFGYLYILTRSMASLMAMSSVVYIDRLSEHLYDKCSPDSGSYMAAPVRPVAGFFDLSV